MSKELKALERVWQDIGIDNNFREDFKDLDLIKQALLELKAIKESNPSKALELAYCLKDYLMNMMPYYDWLNDIEKYIIKAQEKEKVLRIMFEKRVDLCILTDCDNVNEYNKSLGNYRPVEDRLTYEEFDLLKRWNNGL